jgi:hypothetical protein
MRTPAGSLAPVLVLALSFAAPGFAQSPSPVTGQATVTATVRSVGGQPRVVEVTTGVGYALRVVKVTLPEQMEVRTPGGAARPDQLKPGDLVRIDYVKSPEGNKATKVEVLPPPEPGAPR